MSFGSESARHDIHAILQQMCASGEIRGTNSPVLKSVGIWIEFVSRSHFGYDSYGSTCVIAIRKMSARYFKGIFIHFTEDIRRVKMSLVELQNGDEIHNPIPKNPKPGDETKEFTFDMTTASERGELIKVINSSITVINAHGYRRR